MRQWLDLFESIVTEEQLDEGIDDILKFWIRADGTVLYIEPGLHHIDVFSDPGEDPNTQKMFEAFRGGWVRGYFEKRGETMNYCFDQKRVSRQAMKAMLKLARDERAVAFNLEDFASHSQIGGSELDAKQFSLYVRQNTVMAEGLISDEEYDEDAVLETLRDLNSVSLDHFEKIDDHMSIGVVYHQSYLVYWGEKRVIGYVVYSKVNGAKGPGIEVDGVGVNPDHQGRGIGVTMYEALLDRGPIYAGQQTSDGMGLWQSLIRSGHHVLAVSEDEEIEVDDPQYYAKLIRQWPSPYAFVMTKESVLAEGASPVEGLKTFYTITDSYHGQMDGYVQAHVGDHALGYLNFSIYEGVTRIKMIEVAETYRRRGIASALYKCFVENSKGLEIEWGYTTEEGDALKQHLKAL